MRREINFIGSAQTNYGDWGATLVEHYPNNLTYQRVGNTVKAYHKDVQIGFFNFETGTGTLEFDDALPKDPAPTGLQNFTIIDVDKVVRA